MILTEDLPALFQHLLLQCLCLCRLPLGPICQCYIVHACQRVRIGHPGSACSSLAPVPAMLLPPLSSPGPDMSLRGCSCSSACQDGRRPGSGCSSSALVHACQCLRMVVAQDLLSLLQHL